MNRAIGAFLALAMLVMPAWAETVTRTVDAAEFDAPLRTVHNADGRGEAVEASLLERMLELEARVAELEHALADARAQWRQRLLILEQRLAERPVVYVAAESTQQNSQAATAPLPPTAHETATSHVPDSDEGAQQAFDAAIALILDENYPEAIRRLQALLDNDNLGDDSASAAVLPLAAYWLAEAYYAEESYRAALTAYDAFLARYPDDTNYGEALLKRGFSLMELGRYDEAEAALNQVASEYAETNIAVLAARKLEFLYLIQGDSAASSGAAGSQ